jgi:hypothetical protein
MHLTTEDVGIGFSTPFLGASENPGHMEVLLMAVSLERMKTRE